MTKIMPKGIVEPTEMQGICNKIRMLLSNRKNVALTTDWERLQELTKKERCFTTGERDLVELLYGLYEGYKQKAEAKRWAKERAEREAKK